MTYKDVIKQLEAIKNERGIKYYEKFYGNTSKYFGLGLTPLRKIAKKIKINRSLSEELWQSDYFEAKLLSIMIDDPKEYNKDKLLKYISNLPEKYNNNPLSYFTMILTEFIVSKSPDVKDVINHLVKSDKSTDRFIAYSALANLGKSKNNDEDYFSSFVPIIESTIQNEENNVKDAMNNSLLSWGQKTKNLNSIILKLFKKIGKVTVDYGDTSCQTPNVPKILSSERIQAKF